MTLLSSAHKSSEDVDVSLSLNNRPLETGNPFLVGGLPVGPHGEGHEVQAL